MNNVQVFQMDYIYKSFASMQIEMVDMQKEIVNFKCKDNLLQSDISGLKDRYNYLEESSVSNIHKITNLEDINEKQKKTIDKLKNIVIALSSKQACDAYAINKKFDDLVQASLVEKKEIEASHNLQIWASKNAEMFLNTL